MPICSKCNEIIKPAALACTVSGKEYHPTCIHCGVCDKRLWGIPFVRTKDGKLVCEKTCSGKPPPPLPPPQLVRSETRTLIRNDENEDFKPNSIPIATTTNAATSKLKNFNPNSFESQLDLNLTPRVPDATTANVHSEQIKKCNTCNQSVFKKRFITFENGNILCNDCDLKQTPRPARVKSAHMIICSICNKTVRGTRYVTETNGKIVCENCELTGLRCVKCAQLFKLDENHRVLTNGDRFHSECLNCQECGNLIETNDFYETESGNPMCLSCFEISKLPKCFKCNNHISGAFQMLDNRPIHNDCFKCAQCSIFLRGNDYVRLANNETICFNCNLKLNGVECHKCSQIIVKEGVTFGQKDYHQSCFNCDMCKANLMRMKQIYTDKQGEGTFCSQCFMQAYSPKCSKCHNAIGPHQIATNYEEKAFHRECFLCARCKKPLANKKFFKAGNILICEDCF
jgi:hypothetical protein